MPRVRVPGVGTVNFPDSMSSQEIEAAIPGLMKPSDPWAKPHAQYAGPNDAVETNPLLDPITLVGALLGGPVAGVARGVTARGAQSAAGALERGASAVARGARAPIVRRLPLTGKVAGIAEDVAQLAAPKAGGFSLGEISNPAVLKALMESPGPGFPQVSPQAMTWLMKELARGGLQ